MVNAISLQQQIEHPSPLLRQHDDDLLMAGIRISGFDDDHAIIGMAYPYIMPLPIGIPDTFYRVLHICIPQIKVILTVYYYS